MTATKGEKVNANPCLHDFFRRWSHALNLDIYQASFDFP